MFSAGLASPARADDDVSTVLKKISDLERAIQVSRQNAARYQQAQSQYQRAVAAANARIAALSNQQLNAQSQAEDVADDIAIAEEQMSLLTLQLNDTVAYVESLERAEPGRRITVVLPSFVARHWWERILHNRDVLRLRRFLKDRESIRIVDFPYRLYEM